MYGFEMIAIRVEQRGGSGSSAHRPRSTAQRHGGAGAEQIDNIDGRGLDLQAEWLSFFGDTRSDHAVRTRRFWQSAKARPVRAVRADGGPHSWTRLDVEYGPNGIPGRVLDTSAGTITATVRQQDATVFRYRHLLLRPVGGTAALLAAEVIGRSGAHTGPTDAFRKQFERDHADFRVDFERIAGGEYWGRFLAGARLKAVTLSRQTQIPDYLAPGTSGRTVAATIEETIKATGRGARLSSALIPALLERRVTPRDAFGIAYDPASTWLLLEVEGQTKRVYLDQGDAPSIVSPVGDPDRADQPGDAEFLSAAESALTHILASFP